LPSHDSYYIIENRGQGVIKGKEWEELKKYRECLRKGERKVAYLLGKKHSKVAHGQETWKA